MMQNQLDPTTEYLQGYRSVLIRNTEGKEFNITALIRELNLYEDIFANVVSGDAVLADDVAMIDQMNLKGNEKITVELHKDKEERTVEIFEYFIYSSGMRKRPNATSEVYVINFMSVEAVLNEHTRCYSAIEGSPTDAVSSLFDSLGSKKDISVEKTFGHYKFVMPSWTPFEGINWYAGRSVSDESKGSYFLFYETLNGFRYDCVETLIKKEPKYEYHYEPAGTQFLIKDAANIREFEVVEMGDSVKGVSQQYTTLWSHDLIRKRLIKKKFEYGKDQKGKLNGQLLGTSENNAFGLDLTERRERFGSNPVVKLETRNTHSQTNDYTYDAIQPKLSAMRQFANLKVRFLAFGTRKYNVGDVVEMKFLRATNINKENKNEMEDKLLSGKYLVTAVRYMFRPQEFHIAVEAVKDSRKD